MIVLDTHVWLWWLSEPSQLSRNVSKVIRTADRIGVSAVSCFEVATAVARGRISIDRGIQDWLEQGLAQPKVELLPITPAIAAKASQLGRHFFGDPADRLIVATAIMHTAVLVTKDLRIRKFAGVPTIW